MPKSVAVNFSKQSERLNQLEINTNGPGQYELHDSFGKNVNKVTFGVRREENTLDTPGPGFYNPDQAENVVMTRTPAHNFADQSGRNFSEVDGQIGPGSYDYQPQ